jgi:hypothetical protein
MAASGTTMPKTSIDKKSNAIVREEEIWISYDSLGL